MTEWLTGFLLLAVFIPICVHAARSAACRKRPAWMDRDPPPPPIGGRTEAEWEAKWKEDLREQREKRLLEAMRLPQHDYDEMRWQCRTCGMSYAEIHGNERYHEWVPNPGSGTSNKRVYVCPGPPPDDFQI